jgi:hypothetical protein
MFGNLKTVSSSAIAAPFSLSPYLNFIFSMALAIFVLGPPFLGYQFTPYPLMHVADVFDLFTPLVLIPLYWLLFQRSGNIPASNRENLIFMVFAGFWVLGQGMHLSANSIDNLLNLKGVESGDVYSLTYFYDETLGHYLWHFGVIGLSALLIYRQWRNSPSTGKVVTWSNIMAGIVYGFVFFAMVNEGTTVPMGLPFTVLAIILILAGSRKSLKQPLTLMFLTGYCFALILFAIWGIWHQGFPGFFDSGFISN